MNKGAINILVLFLCGHEFSNRLGKYLGVKPLDHKTMFALQETAEVSSKLAIHFGFPPAMNESFCSAPSPAICIFAFQSFY